MSRVLRQATSSTPVPSSGDFTSETFIQTAGNPFSVVTPNSIPIPEKNETTNQFAVPGTNHEGMDQINRLQMSLLSGIEVEFALKQFLIVSNRAPYMIDLKKQPALLDSLINLIGCDDRGVTAVLILRNLAQDTDSTQVLAVNAQLKEFILTVLRKKEYTELYRYCIDLAEAISSFIAPAPQHDELFLLLEQVLSSTRDRYLIISSLRSLSRLLVRSKIGEPSAADDVNPALLEQVISYLYVDGDSELIMAALDFLYQYCLPGRFDFLNRDLQTLLPHLLKHNVALPNYETYNKTLLTLAKKTVEPIPTSSPALTKELIHQMVNMNEPMRATAWMRSCFKPVSNAEVTQISLWKSYEGQFDKLVKLSGRKLLPAVDFIKNVSNAFRTSSAMVLTQEDGSKKFIIRGIQPRAVAVSVAQGDREALNPQAAVVQSTTTAQAELPQLKYATHLSDVSKAAATFLSLVAQDRKVGLPWCRLIRDQVENVVVDVPLLMGELKEFFAHVV